MAITFTAGAESLGTASETSRVVTLPAGYTDGDYTLIVAGLVGSAGGFSTTPTGYSVLLPNTDSVNGSTSAHGVVYYRKWVTGDGSATLTFGSGRCGAQAVRVSGAHASAFVDVTPVVTQGAASTTTLTAPSITTTSADAVLLALFIGRDGGAATAPKWTPPAGMTELVDVGPPITGTTNPGTLLASLAVPTPGATGTKTATADRTLAGSFAASFAIKVASTAPAESGTGAAQTLGLTLGAGAGSSTVTPVAPTLTHRIVGIPTGSTAQVAIKTDAATARLKVGTNAAVTTGVVFGPAATPDADGYAQLTVSGLGAGTRYYYRVAMTPSGGAESLDTAGTVGSFRTAPSGQSSFAFTFGSCTNATDSPAMAAMAARGDDLFFHLGDLYYADGSGTGLTNIRSKMQAQVQTTNHQALLATTPSAYTPSDHDGMTNNSVAGDDATAWTNWRTAYGQLWPATATYHSFAWGRIRFIQLDDRNYKTATAATDNAAKTALGATQKQWLKDTITAATEPVVVIAQSSPWTGTAAGDDGWAGYTTERAELGAFFAASGKKIVMLAGDMHALAADDGTHTAGGITLFHAAPFANSASQKYPPYTVGPYPTDASTVQQYGRCVVTDSGSSISLAFTGYSADNTARVTLTATATVATTGTGSALSLPLTAGAGTGGAATPNAASGGGGALSLSLVVGAGSGATTVRSYTFAPPTQERLTRIEGRLFASMPYGLSVWRTAGAWSRGFMPTAEVVAAADLFYGGGRVHSISQAERDDLIAAGYGANIEEPS